MSAPQSKQYLSKPKVGKRYGVTSRTVDRWKKRDIIPPPDIVVNGRGYWLEAKLEQHDRRLVAERGELTK